MRMAGHRGVGFDEGCEVDHRLAGLIDQKEAEREKEFDKSMASFFETTAKLKDMSSKWPSSDERIALSLESLAKSLETIAAAAKHRELVAMRNAAINDSDFEPVVSAEIDRVLAVLLPGWK